VDFLILLILFVLFYWYWTNNIFICFSAASLIESIFRVILLTGRLFLFVFHLFIYGVYSVSADMHFPFLFTLSVKQVQPFKTGKTFYLPSR